ncbi:hypothetical protein TNCV_324951 [Trichonephila clavipes]|nr:hypothetical protein TNCV_324951 [Trichonephila clavipes]
MDSAEDLVAIIVAAAAKINDTRDLREGAPVVPTHVQRHLCKPTGAKSIKRWYEMFKETISVRDPPRNGRRNLSKAIAERIRQPFQRSPTKSTHETSWQLLISQIKLFIKGLDCMLIKCKTWRELGYR